MGIVYGQMIPQLDEAPGRGRQPPESRCMHSVHVVYNEDEENQTPLRLDLLTPRGTSSTCTASSSLRARNQSISRVLPRALCPKLTHPWAPRPDRVPCSLRDTLSR